MIIQRLLRAVFGSRNDRLLKQYSKTVARINALEPAMAALSDEALAAKTPEFKQRLADQLKDVPAEDLKDAEARALEELLPEAFAVVREASKRTLDMRHFDVQLLGGMVLHYGKIAEMRTGEGKTLVATLPAYLNALTGKGVQIVTVNDYLASRDAEWMGKVYTFLGLTVGVILSQMPHEQKHGAYAADITYGTNNEFGFDYLRDNMAMRVEERFQRGLNYAIVDEVDSILIDEARTPLIISGPAEDRTDVYNRINEIAPMLSRQAAAPAADGEPEVPGDFYVDEKNHTVLLSEKGHEHAEALLARAGLLPDGGSLYDPANINLMHHLSCALRAHNLFFRDRHYVVQDGDVVIVDEFTGRLMPGRRWSDGLHQAVEAKEHVAIQNENQTLASITFQNYFRMYNKLAGMTGTADTEAYEFQEIYGLETVVIPTHKPMIREDRLDQVYKTETEKYQAVARRHPRLPQARPAGAGRHHVDRELREARGAPAEGGAAAPGAQRQAARRRGADRRPGRRAGRGHHRHQHGGPRHRHRARRQHREAGRCAQGRSGDPGGREGGAHPQAARRMEGPARAGRGRGRPAHHRHRAPRVAADRQSAARALRPAGRPGLVALLPLPRGRAAAHLRRRPHQGDHGAAQDARGRADRARDGHPLDRDRRSARSRRTTSTSASSCSSTTTSRTTSARRSTSCATRSSTRRAPPTW